MADWPPATLWQTSGLLTFVFICIFPTATHAADGITDPGSLSRLALGRAIRGINIAWVCSAPDFGESKWRDANAESGNWRH